MPAFTIKRANTNDIAIIRNLQEKIWFHTYLPILEAEQVQYMFDAMYSIEALQEQLLTYQHTFILLYADEKPIGFASFSEMLHENKIKLHKIYVLPESQGTGAGKFLMSAVITLAQETNLRVLELNVNRNNKARFFYEKMGFVISKEVDIPFGPYWMNDYVMSYVLQDTVIE
jgi:GNAT superfamily N-acetyltransferase